MYQTFKNVEQMNLEMNPQINIRNCSFLKRNTIAQDGAIKVQSIYLAI